jgi:hypothetical protein
LPWALSPPRAQRLTIRSDSRPTLAESLAVFLSVVSSLLVGAVLVWTPWTELWESNYFLTAHSTLRGWVLSAFTRGAVTGLGLVNIILAFVEAHQHLVDRTERI